MSRNKTTNFSIVIGLCFVACCLSALVDGQVKASSAKNYLNAGEADMQAWRKIKFGLFVHWGPVSLKRTEIGWSRGGKHRGRNDRSTGLVPIEVYVLKGQSYE